MKRAFASLILVAGVLSGCVDIRQEIHVKHDASGKIVETIVLRPRALRLLEGMAMRSAEKKTAPVLLSKEFLEERAKSLGEVKLESMDEAKLPDGRKQLKLVYTFKDLNKVRFWVVPTLSYKKKDATDRRSGLDGALKLKFQPRYVRFGRIYRETVTIETTTTRFMPRQKLSSPARRQEYARVLPVFLDMLEDFHLSVTVVAPIESFEEPDDMLCNVVVDGNRVTVLEIDGRGVVQAPGMVHQLIMNEVIGGGDLARHQRSMPGVFTPWPAIHRGRYMRFMKTIPESGSTADDEKKPAPKADDGKKKDRKKNRKKREKKKEIDKGKEEKKP